MSRLSPLILPVDALRLAGRFCLPLALWYTVGELLRYAVMYGGYRLSLVEGVGVVAPMATVSLLVLITLSVTVAMTHALRDGLDAVRERSADGDLTPWAVGNDESMLDALTRALLPFTVFYLAWQWFVRDVREFYAAAQGRGFAEGGLSGQIRGQGMLLELQEHLYVAVGLTVGFFVAKLLLERLLEPALPRATGVLVAFAEVNWTLFGVFTIEELRRKAAEWITGRVAWGWVQETLGPVLGGWPMFKHAVLGALVWLVIAGVILGLDARDEQLVLGRSRAARRLARAGGIGEERSAREVVTRGLRDMWLPTWYGLRLVRRSGPVTFGFFAVLLMGLDVLEHLTVRGVYELLGPHPVAWWMPRLHPIGFGTGLVFQMLRICLLAAAFNLVVRRVSERTAAKAALPSDDLEATTGSPAPPT